MKYYKLILGLIIAILTCTSCAHRTIHEVCSDEGTVSRYKDYDQCYVEESARRERKRRMAQAWSDSWTRNTTRCTTTGGNGVYNTSCN